MYWSGKTVDSFRLEIEINMPEKLQNLSLKEKRNTLKLRMFSAITRS